ncbi:MAG: hypothetical protein EYC70_05405 [Planctomycetota bacterium]|nr:MAG: hypothetical protein EYC70_05405 [Planctomycetota bacterium]
MLPLVPLLLCCAAQAAQDTVILQPDAVILEDGSLQPGAVVLVKRDRVLAAGLSVPQPAGAALLRVRGVLAPGFVDAFTRLGLADDANESSAAVTPQLLCADSVDTEDPVWQRLLEHGITAVHLVPPPVDMGPGGNYSVNVAAGWSALAATGGGERVTDPRARQVFSLHEAPGGGALASAGPTSLPGVLEVLNRAVEAGVPGLVERGALFQVESAAAVRAASSLAQKYGCKSTWIVRGDPGSFGGELAGEVVGVPVLAEGSWQWRTPENWRRLHAAGVRIAFGSDAAGPDWNAFDALRTSAMALSRASGDPKAALAAVTGNAAALAGQSRERGRIGAGARADLVLWSGHPLDASSRVLAVMVGGRTVYTAQQP